MSQELSPKVESIRNLLADAKKKGLVMGKHGIPVPGKPDWAEIVYPNDVLGASRVANRYYTGKNGKIFGTIEVFLYGDLGYVMPYGGNKNCCACLWGVTLVD